MLKVVENFKEEENLGINAKRFPSLFNLNTGKYTKISHFKLQPRCWKEIA